MFLRFHCMLLLKLYARRPM